MAEEIRKCSVCGKEFNGRERFVILGHVATGPGPLGPSTFHEAWWSNDEAEHEEGDPSPEDGYADEDEDDDLLDDNDEGEPLEELGLFGPTLCATGPCMETFFEFCWKDSRYRYRLRKKRIEKDRERRRREGLSED